MFNSRSLAPKVNPTIIRASIYVAGTHITIICLAYETKPGAVYDLELAI